MYNQIKGADDLIYWEKLVARGSFHILWLDTNSTVGKTIWRKHRTLQAGGLYAILSLKNVVAFLRLYAAHVYHPIWAIYGLRSGTLVAHEGRCYKNHPKAARNN